MVPRGPSLASRGCVARDRRSACHEETGLDRPERAPEAAEGADVAKVVAAWAGVVPVQARLDSAFAPIAGSRFLTR